jgi:hypothetical protein
MIATANTGARLLTFFTSEDRIPEDDDSDTTTVTFQELAEELRACTSFAGVVINPSGDSLDNALVMSRGDVFRIAGIEDSGATRGGDSYKIAARVHMHYTFSAPDQVQFRLVSDLHSALRKFPDIRDVYYLTAHSDNAEAPIPFFAVDFDGDEDSVHNTVSDVIGRHFNRTVFTVVKTDDVLLKIARAKGLSVYSRAG